MAVVCTLRKNRAAWLWGYAILCAVLGLWGAYDYFVRIPAQEQLSADYAALKERFETLQKKADTGASLSQAERDEYAHAKDELGKFAEAPAPVAGWDRPLQLWVYIIGCGCVSTPWFLWSLVKARRMRIELSDLSPSGVVTSGTTSLPEPSITEVDMSRWMSKSKAVLRASSGETIEIDDYLLQDGYIVVGYFAHKFHPDQWTETATLVKAAGSGDDAAAPAGDDAQSPAGGS